MTIGEGIGEDRRSSFVTATIEYITDGIGVEGRETYEIQKLADGSRLLRARSEMYNDALQRDTLLRVDRDWSPQSAQLHLMVHDEFVGVGQYDFTAEGVRFAGSTATQGLVTASELRGTRIPAFGGHAVQNDAWLFAAFDRLRGPAEEVVMPGVVISSRLPNGGDGPALHFSDQRMRFVGEAEIETKAGAFATRQYLFLLSDRPPIHYWISGEDYLLVRARWDLLKQTYDLVSLASASCGTSRQSGRPES